MAKKHKTSINYLRLPIFSGSRSATPTNNTHLAEYRDNDKTYNVEIRNGNLSSFHRKIFIGLEFLYLKQNPNFERNFIRTSFKDIQTSLNLKGNYHKTILSTLEDLQRVNIKSVITTKHSEKETLDEDGIIFNLLPKIAWHFSKTIDERTKEQKRQYTNHIDIYFEDFHIQNLKNRYYRLINFELVKQLKPNTLRFFDYLNLNSYFEKDGIYHQKMNLRIDYNSITDYLLLKKLTNKSWKERQFIKQLEELKEKGVIKAYSFEHNLFDETTIILQLAQSINLWSKYNPRINENIPKYTPLQNKLKERSIPNKQIIYLTTNYIKEFIIEKIEQFDYVMKFLPNKIRGRGSYLYNSIKDDWIDDKYITYKENLKQKDLNLFTQTASKKLQKKKEQYIIFCREKCIEYWNTIEEVERQSLDKLILKEVEEDGFLNKTKSLSSFGYVAKKFEILHKIVILPTFEEWEKIIYK